MARIVDWPARMAEVAKFVGLGPAELELLRATAPMVLKHADELTAGAVDRSNSSSAGPRPTKLATSAIRAGQSTMRAICPPAVSRFCYD